MRYEIRRANEFAWGPDGPWQVEKVMRLGERYVVGIFEDIADANEIMRLLEKNLEYQTWEVVRGKRQPFRQTAGYQTEEGGGDAA